jgi:hypothetical protein
LVLAEQAVSQETIAEPMALTLYFHQLHQLVAVLVVVIL